MPVTNEPVEWYGRHATYLIDRYQKVVDVKEGLLTRDVWEKDLPYIVIGPKEIDSRKRITLFWFLENMRFPWGLFASGKDNIYAFHDPDDALLFKMTWC